MRIVAIIQARTSSQRLPNKVLTDIRGAPMLARVAARAARAKRVDEVAIATSDRTDDDALVPVASALGLRLVRGSLDDVVGRYLVAAETTGADVVVRLTADCPLIDPEIIDEVVEAYLEGGVDYASNVWPERTFPRGLDTEVMSRAALEMSARDATEPSHREHVTQFILRNPQLFAMRNVVADTDFSEHRWTVDTEEDLDLVRRITGELETPFDGWRKILALLARHPDWVALNQHIEQKKA